MIIDTTVSFHEKRVCMARQLCMVVERKRVKKQKKEDRTQFHQFLIQLHDKQVVSTQTLLEEFGFD